MEIPRNGLSQTALLGIIPDAAATLRPQVSPRPEGSYRSEKLIATPPAITKLLRLDTYRDGGSLSATFTDNFGQKHSLFFKIAPENTDLAADKRFYDSASIVSYTERNYISPVTGLTLPMASDEQSQAISWEDALILLEKIRPHVDSLESDYQWVFQSMVNVASTGGWVSTLPGNASS